MDIVLMLIMLLFGSFGGLQSKAAANAEDTQRRAAVSMMSAAINGYQANNQGILPAESELHSCTFLGQVSDNRASGASAVCAYVYTTAGPDAKDTIKTSLRVDCDGGPVTRGFSVSTLLSSGERYCLDV